MKGAASLQIFPLASNIAVSASCKSRQKTLRNRLSRPPAGDKSHNVSSTADEQYA
jgi:hypothetical protein